MKKAIIKIARLLLPKKIYRFIRMRPVLMFIPYSLSKKLNTLIDNTWKEDFDQRGDINSYLIKITHILDKGLQRPDISPGHSKLIVQSIKDRLLDTNSIYEENHRDWAKKLLQVYQDLQVGKFNYNSEFTFKIKHSLPIQELKNHMLERRSIRHFSNDYISAADLKDVLELLPLAPSSCNRQTANIFITEDPGKIDLCLAQNKGATGISGKFIFISLTFDSRSYHLPQEILSGYIDASLAFQNFILGIHSIGLGATILNWSHADDSEEKILRKTLSIPQHNQIVCNCIVGKPKYGAPMPSKKSPSEFVKIIN